MNHQELLDIYSDYLLSSFGPTTATGLARLVGGSLSHDEITRLLAGEVQSSAAWWPRVKPLVRQNERQDGVLIFDDSIEEKPYIDENEIIGWHYEHSQARNRKGINFLTALYHNGEVSLPVAFPLMAKTETDIDGQSGKSKRRSPKTKNAYYRDLVTTCVRHQLRFRYVLNDRWSAAVDHRQWVKGELERDFIRALKRNRKVAHSAAAKAAGQFQTLSTLATPEGTVCEVWREGLAFPLLCAKPVFTNEEGSTGTLYLVTSDLTLDFLTLTTLYQKRWKIEEYHRSLKQKAALAKSPTRTVTTQTNHFVAALYAYVKLEMRKVATKLNHYALKAKLYLSALQPAYRALQKLQPVSLSAAYLAA